MMGSVQAFDFKGQQGITSEMIKAYKADGVICLRDAVSEKWLELIEIGISEFLTKKDFNRGDPSAVPIKRSGDKGNFYYSTLMWKEINSFHSLIFESGLPQKFGGILESSFLN